MPQTRLTNLSSNMGVDRSGAKFRPIRHGMADCRKPQQRRVCGFIPVVTGDRSNDLSTLHTPNVAHQVLPPNIECRSKTWYRPPSLVLRNPIVFCRVRNGGCLEVVCWRRQARHGSHGEWKDRNTKADGARMRQAVGKPWAPWDWFRCGIGS